MYLFLQNDPNRSGGRENVTFSQNDAEAMRIAKCYFFTKLCRSYVEDSKMRPYTERCKVMRRIAKCDFFTE